MKKSDSKLVRIGGQALKMLQQLKDFTNLSYKNSAEFLIEQSKGRLELIYTYLDSVEKRKEMKEKERCQDEKI